MSELTILQNGNTVGSISWNEPEKDTDGILLNSGIIQ